MINQLQHNIQWGQKGNFVDVPTDCPQRDERLGWTGDAQVFARTACFNADVAGFYTKWLGDVAADQKADGAVPHVIPDVLSRGQATGGASAGWADAAVVVPWTVYLCYGDKRLLERQYPSMKAWVDYMTHRAGQDGAVEAGLHLWRLVGVRHDPVGLPGCDDRQGSGLSGLLREVYGPAAAGGDCAGQDPGRPALCESSSRRSRRPSRRSSSRPTPGSPRIPRRPMPSPWPLTCCRLHSGSLRRSGLAADVSRFKHITTGFLGTPVICRVLSDHGYLKEAYMLLNRRDYPSWLYPITQGATTIWERWDGIKPDGSFQDEGMNSFNHYAYGAIGEWLYAVVAGLDLDPESVAYKHSLIQPHPGGGLTSAKATLESPYGKVASGWQIKDKSLIVDVVIPPNTTATLTLPKAGDKAVTESGKPVAKAEGVRSVQQKGGVLVAELGSGVYRFEYLWTD